MTLAQTPHAQKSSHPEPLEDLLAVLRQRNVSLWIEGDRLRYRAAKDALTPDLMVELKERKAEILEFLHRAKLQIQPTNQPQIVPIERTGKLPVSFNQQRLWLLEQFDPGKPVYNLPLAYRLQGTLNVDTLRCCLEKIVQRHEVLRSTFHVDNNEPYQSLVSKLEVSLPIIDLQHLPEDRREESAKQVATEGAKKPFSLKQGPLFRFELLRLSPKQHVLIYNTHHIISDGWSSEVFFKELTTLYAAFSINHQSPLPELPVQYVDYADWQRRWLAGGVLQTQLNYWKQVLDGDLPVLQLPTDHPRPATSSYRGEIGRKMLPEPLTAALKKISQQGNTTLSMTLMTAFKVLLYRYSGQEDIIVGSPIAGRNRLETEGLIGFFVNTLVFRTDLSGNPSFREALERVRQVSLGAYANQDIPFDQLVQEIRPDRDPSRSPIFQAMFAMNAPWTQGASRELPDMTITSTFGYVHNSSSKFDLSLVMRDTGKGLRVSIEYSLDLFEQSTIERIISHFQTLLEGIIANPDQTITALPLLPETERQQLDAWNKTDTPCNSTVLVHQLFEQAARQMPDALAIQAGSEQITYEDLNARANQLANRLTFLGISSDTLVGICLERSPKFILAALAILKASGAYVPLDPNYPTDRLAFMLEDSGVKVLLTEQRLLTHIPTQGIKVLRLDTDWSEIAQESCENLLNQAKENNLAYVIYTSGSTGKPKGVEICHSGLLNLVFWHQREYQVATTDRATQIASPAFDASVWELWPYLTAGASIHIPDEETRGIPAKLADWLASQAITLSFLPTPLAEALLQEPLPPLVLRALLTGGDALHYVPTRSLSFQLVNHYGPTENTVVTTWTQVVPQNNRSNPPPIGQPIANTQVYVLDKNLQPVPIGLSGELYIGGMGLAKGYLNRPELTAEKFIANPFSSDPNARLYKTGDLARWLPNGQIEYLGRVDDQVKVRGFRVELGEIEANLLKHSAVREAVVVVREDVVIGEPLLVGYFVTTSETPDHNHALLVELRQFLKSQMPDFMVPTHLLPLAALPLTPNGKVDRKVLPKVDVSQQLAVGYEAPQTELEQQVAELWAEVMGIERIGIHDNFFELGGHSLLAVRLFALIEKKFSRNLPLATLLQAPTVQQLADVLRQDQEADVWSPLVAIKPDGSRPPLFCIHGGGFNVLVYRDLTLGLHSEQPVYGLQAQGLNGRGGVWANTLEDIAADYINEIRAVQPHGPYHLAGLSNGGNIALEMAQQLHAQGEQVNLLAMFDCYGPRGVELLPPFPRVLSSLGYALQYSVPRWFAKVQQSESSAILAELHKSIKLLREATTPFSSKSTEQSVSGQEAKQDSSHLTSLSQESLIERGMNRVSLYILQHSPWSFFNPSDQLKSSDDKIAKTLKNLEETHRKIYKAYVLKPYPGKITLFRAAECPPGYRIAPHLGWDKIAQGGVETYKIPGHHTSIMKSPVLAEKMRVCLEKALNNSCSP